MFVTGLTVRSQNKDKDKDNILNQKKNINILIFKIHQSRDSINL